MLPDAKCEDSGCVPAYLRSSRLHSTAVLAQLLPFLLTFALTFVIAYRQFYPRLSGHSLLQENVKWPSSSSRLASWPPRVTAQRLMALSFSTTFSLVCIVPELVLCEISDLLHPEARGLAMRATISGLLALLLVVTPLLQLHSTIKGSGLGFRGNGKLSSRVGWALEAIGFLTWITGFWWLGQGLPGTHPVSSLRHADGRTVREACIARVAVIGVALMALLSGFASVSTPWQKFGVKSHPVTETDITRKQAGLEATEEMLTAKESRLRALERKMVEVPSEGLLTKVMGAVRGNADSQECKSLQLEIHGLQTMQSSLRSSLSVLQRRRYAQQRMSTRLGRLLSLANFFFSIYCLYRVITASISVLRHWWSPNASHPTADPITNLIALIAEHVNPAIDQVAWARQISFILSGVILLASFSSVIQTIHLFSRFAPTMLFLHAQANIALLISQISGTYVISSALLLRSSLPLEMGTVISEALGAPLEPSIVDHWFEGWFLVASLGTGVGILVAKKLAGPGEWDDDDIMDRDPEAGTKRS